MDRKRGQAADRRSFLVTAARVAAAAGLAAGSLHLLTRPGAAQAAPCGLPRTCPGCAVRAGCGFLSSPRPDPGRRE